jgi:hypothetical protein
MTNLTVQVPDRLAKELNKAGQEFIAEMLELGLRTRKIEQALERYARGEMTLGAAADMAGIMEGEMARQAHARVLEPRFTEETLAEELA